MLDKTSIIPFRPQVVYFAMRAKESSRAFQGRTFTPANGNKRGTCQVFSDDSLVIKAPFSKEEQARRGYALPAEVFFRNYSLVERRAGSLAVPFKTYGYLAFPTGAGFELACQAVVQEKIKEEDLFFSRVLRWLEREDEAKIKGLMDRFFEFQKELIRHGIFMGDPNFWNYALVNSGSRIVGFDFDWVYGDFSAPYPSAYFTAQGQEGYLDLARKIYAGELLLFAGQRGFSYSERQKAIILRTSRHLQKGFQALWSRQLFNKTWGQAEEPVSSPY